MKRLESQLALGSILSLLFFSWGVPAAQAASASVSSPSIQFLNPNSGNGGIPATITGQNLGNKTAYDFGLGYVRFGGYIDTQVSSWNGTDIQIVVPSPQDSLSNYSEADLFWTVGNLASLDMLDTVSFGLKSLSADASALILLHNTTVTVTVVPSPFVQSNGGTFTYLAQPVSQLVGNIDAGVAKAAYDYYLADKVELLSHPIQATEDFFRSAVRGAIEIPAVIYDTLAKGRTPAQTISHDNTAQTNQESAAAPTGGSETTSKPTSNNQIRNLPSQSNSTSTQKSQTTQSTTHTVSATVLDSSGRPYSIGCLWAWLADSQGNEHDMVNYETSTGNLNMGTVADGQYTLHIVNYNCGVNYTSATRPEITQPVQVSGADVFLGTITVPNQ